MSSIDEIAAIPAKLAYAVAAGIACSASAAR
jgi:hypothetical protein